MNIDIYNKANNRVTRFINENILDAIEALETRKYTKEEIATLGQLKAYADGTVEFYWRGSLAIVFPKFEIDRLGMLNLDAIHVYDDNRKDSFQ